MFKNYIKIAWRSLLKNKLQTTINLLGLTVGTICCLSIIVFVLAQLGYDTHHENTESLYRIRTVITGNGNGGADFNSATSSPPIAFAMKEDFPEVVEACRIVYFGEGNDALIKVQNSNNSYYESRGYLADSTFFKLFNYSFVEGRPSGALTQPNTIVLSSTLKEKLFGNQNSENQTLVLGSGENEIKVIVTGVFDDSTKKSHLNPNYILSMNSPGLGEFVRNEQNFATQNFVHSYVKLLPGSEQKQLERKLPNFIQTRGGQNLADVGFDKSLFLQKVKDIHLYSKGISNQIDKVSNIQYLYLLLILALFIQLVACVNFINLSTARANKRAKEIGIRKAVGANKGSLVRQFLGESVLLSFLALLISIPLTAVVLPFVNILTKGNIEYTALFQIEALLPLVVLSIVSGLFAGAYPALVLSSIKPIKVLKGTINVSSGNGNFRKALVVFQFIVSITLIIAVIVVNKQVKYSQNLDMGFDKENLIAIRLGTDETVSRFSALRSQILNVSGVLDAAGSNHYPSEFIMGDLGLHLPGGNPANQTLVKYNGVSDNYFKTVGTSFLAGRDLRANDSTQIVVNKATIDAFNIDLENALASKLIQTYEGRVSEYEIVGVVDNYHFSSLKESIAPIMLFNENAPGWVIVKTETKDYKTLLANLEQSWESTNPNTPFVFHFIDSEVEKLFAEEKRLGQISIVFTCLAILISCLGLFGLISFMAEQKKKEIGIRKVLGASVGNVVNMLTKDFVKLVAIALLIAAPLAYYYLENWLEGFAYRISIDWWLFILAGGITMVITVLTVSIQAFKAATANPTKSLRTE
ncbi:ABC transporter permease [Aquimarina aggregata]|uniref:ABC transporter permease n=1 Tax=Aquimarina aggregata TaxID=1642818 RepID=A0A162WED1_9FLAO|nr:ABC transporter permease [Aquimarina aggregata]KZS38044.1 ABC transporter permease [Aquimarina aggregata]